MIYFLIGVAASLIASIIIYALKDLSISLLSRVMGWLPFKSEINLKGNWSSTWYVESEKFSKENTDNNSVIRQIGKHVYLEHNTGQIKFNAKGKIEGGRYVTGVWYDQTESGYHGAFQLIIDPLSKNMDGQWLGYSSTGIVKNGRWVWERGNDKN
jgi:hypothetical protein